MAAAMKKELDILKDIIQNRFELMLKESITKLDDALKSPRSDDSKNVINCLIANGYSLEYLDLKAISKEVIATSLIAGKSTFFLRMGFIQQNHELQLKAREIINKICQSKNLICATPTIKVIAAVFLRRFLLVINFHLASAKNMVIETSEDLPRDKENISEESVHYVGGFVLQSMKKKITKIQGVAEKDVLKLTDNLTASFDEKHDYDDLSRSLNRGGLLNLNEQGFIMFKTMADIASKF